jgi:hypothetical protein
MKCASIVIGMIIAASTWAVPTAQAQEAAQPSGQQTLAATMKIYVFPTQGQTPEQQSADEASCYGWAVENTGTDPFELAKQAQAQQQQAEQAQQQAATVGHGSGAAGAVRGAAVGALVGEIADNDAGKGAAYGAAVGAVAGRRRGRRANQQAQAEAQAQAAQAQGQTAADMDNFKKAFSVCLEANAYMVKY